MRDYTVTIAVTMSVPAKNAEQAQERADYVSEHLTLAAPPRKPTWWPDGMDLSIEIEED